MNTRQKTLLIAIMSLIMAVLFGLCSEWIHPMFGVGVCISAILTLVWTAMAFIEIGGDE